MDQGCAYGDRAVLMTFDGDRIETKEIRPARDLHFVIVDLKAGKDTVAILKDGRLVEIREMNELNEGFAYTGHVALPSESRDGGTVPEWLPVETMVGAS